jgi:hypothetical protein
MEISTDTNRFFFCRTCLDRNHGQCKRVRTLPAGKLPTVACESCGSMEFEEFTGTARTDVIERLGRENIHGARLFLCRACAVSQVIHGSDRVQPCGCGSRYFDQIIGPARIEWLRERRGEDGRERTFQQ